MLNIEDKFLKFVVNFGETWKAVDERSGQFPREEIDPSRYIEQ